MKSSFAVLLSLALSTGPVVAQSQDHGAHHPTSSATPAESSTELTDGEVRKVDKLSGKLTLRHGVIRNLDMPPMTMVFQVKDPALLDRLEAGDKVRFRAEKDAGVLIVTAIEPAR